MQTKIVQYSHGLTPSFDAKLPAGTEIFVNKVPWDWSIHVKVFLLNSSWNVCIFNAELPDGETNPIMDDLHQLIWFDEIFSLIEDFKKYFECTGIKVPEKFFSRLESYRKEQELIPQE